MFPTLFQLQLKIQDAAATTLPYGTVTRNPLGVFISNILPLILIIAAFLVLFLFLQAGIDWISAGGDKGKIEKAREKITGTVVGMIVLFSAFAIFLIMQRIFGFEILSFTKGLNSSEINRLQGGSNMTPAEQNALQNANSGAGGNSGSTNNGGTGTGKPPTGTLNQNSLKQVR